MSSTFYIDKNKANPKELTVLLSGTLRRFVGLQALKDERKTYALKFAYKDAHLSIVHFTQLLEKDDA